MVQFASDDEIKSFLSQPNVKVLDVRNESEVVASGAFPNSILVPVDRVAAEAPAKLGNDKDAPIIVHCAAGIRAERAAQMLKQAQFKNVINAGGLSNLMRFASKI